MFGQIYVWFWLVVFQVSLQKKMKYWRKSFFVKNYWYNLVWKFDFRSKSDPVNFTSNVPTSRPTFQRSGNLVSQRSNVPTFQRPNVPTFQRSNVPTFRNLGPTSREFGPNVPTFREFGPNIPGISPTFQRSNVPGVKFTCRWWNSPRRWWNSPVFGEIHRRI